MDSAEFEICWQKINVLHMFKVNNDHNKTTSADFVLLSPLSTLNIYHILMTGF